MSGTIAARIAVIDVLAPALRRFVLTASDRPFPPVSAGSHAVLAFGDETRRWKNPYSIVNAAEDGSSLTVIIRREESARGGSAFLHDRAMVGMRVDVASIGNLFPIVRTARRHLMVSGGIGITPFLAYIEALERIGADYVLLHVCRPDERAAFANLLPDGLKGDVRIHAGRRALDLPALLAAQPVGTRLYACGPDGFMDHVATCARQVGFPDMKIHLERFSAAAGGAAFTVTLARDGRRIAVGADQTLLEALEAAGVDVPSLCRGGACGMCRVRVLDGRPDHRDHVLTKAERMAGTEILTCVSRTMGATLTLDL
ncbi:PDR/VanB family oxidoreductase [Nguyenibacter vanlangensis]|uniref:Oxidoreductase n=1 Tax=Nguyenibacter vanlangensis TaxID=1216886 RepID=A0A7Y7ISU4_9PROT|nr:PDR/VanB family oxidoreductase [Nguyenibacter vanlangensis]NVN09680.1 oxidoreductase [Nguyenibacter vanlangensis]